MLPHDWLIGYPGVNGEVWSNYYTHYKVLDEIIYLFPNFNSAAVEVWE